MVRALRSCEPFIVRSASADHSSKGCTAERSRPGPGVNPESAGLAVELRTFKWFFGSLWKHQRRRPF